MKNIDKIVASSTQPEKQNVIWIDMSLDIPVLKVPKDNRWVEVLTQIETENE